MLNADCIERFILKGVGGKWEAWTLSLQCRHSRCPTSFSNYSYFKMVFRRVEVGRSMMGDDWIEFSRGSSELWRRALLVEISTNEKNRLPGDIENCLWCKVNLQVI